MQYETVIEFLKIGLHNEFVRTGGSRNAYISALEIAIGEVGKSIDKEVIETLCPHCENELDVENKTRCCNICGQKLNWVGFLIRQ